jgi:hypothetical protein
LPNELSAEQQARLVELLALIYRHVPWARVHVRNVWDVWNHRVRAAAAAETLGAFVSRLCNWFGIQSLPPEHLALVDAMAPDTRRLLDLVAREHIPLCMRAVLMVRGERTARRARVTEELKETAAPEPQESQLTDELLVDSTRGQTSLLEDL